MKEAQRQAYLHLMQVDSYVPRLALPGAKPSPVREAAPVSSPVSRPVSPPLRPQPPGDRQKTPEPPVIPAPMAAPSHTAQSKDERGHGSVRFQLRYYLIDDDLAVLDEIPHQGGQQRAMTSTDQEITLLKAILRALGVSAAACAELRPASEFMWPVHADLPPTDAEPAWKGLDGYVRSRYESHGFKNLIVFGGACSELISGSLDQKPEAPCWPGLGVPVTVTRSLTAMLTVPVLKREVWRDLQPLLQRLSPDRQSQSAKSLTSSR